MEVLENWEVLVKKGGDTWWYRDALLKDECVFVVEEAIADFGMEHGICRQALTDHVIGALHVTFDERGEDGGFPFYPSEDGKDLDWSDRRDEIEEEDGDSDDNKNGIIDHSDK